MKKNKNSKRTVQISINAVLVAVYIVLASMEIPIGGLKITFEHFPVVLSAVVFGPTNGVIVGLLGELVNQLLTYGFTLTTVLWILPIVFRGLSVGICAKVWKRQMSPNAILTKKIPALFIAVCVISGLLSSCLNTVALYVDSKMFGYYTYAMVFGALIVRLLLSACTSVIISFATKPILRALKHAQLI